MKKTFEILIFIALFFLASTAWSCTSPTGVEGQFEYHSSALHFCDGTNWIAAQGSNTASGCSTAGEIIYHGGNIRYCNGSVYVETGDLINHGTCSNAGYFYYATATKRAWYCNGSNWREMN